MAWNDVYSNDNGVHLLVTVGGRSYNFSKAVDLKVERKIGDTLSKFSLGIIDDGTTTFQEFEMVLTNKFVNIDIAYGNSSKTVSKFTGFVVDYQPSFLGPSSKLTVSGYVSRLHSGTKKLTSLYNYWINWSPVVGARKETDKPWAMIYDGNFRFNNDMSDAARTVTENNLWDGNEEAANTIIEEALSGYKSRAEELEQKYREARKSYEGVDFFSWTIDDAIDAIVTGTIVGTTVTSQTGNVLLGLTAAVISGIQKDLSKPYLEWQSAKASYEKLKKQLEEIRSNDNLTNASGRLWDYGHVPWKYDIISQYNGNIKFKKFEHEGNAIARVIPDIFIPWDKTVPATLLESDIKKENIEDKLKNFEDGVVCDITMFGLKYTFYQDLYKNGSNPLDAYELSLYDKHGTLRVFKTNSNYYIWVGDIPELYNKFKNNDWNYQDGDIEVNLKEDKILSNYNNGKFADGTIAYYVYKPDTEYKVNDMIASGKLKTNEWLEVTLSDDDIKKINELNNKIGKNADDRMKKCTYRGDGFFGWYYLNDEKQKEYGDSFIALKNFLIDMLKSKLSGDKLNYLFTEGKEYSDNGWGIDQATFVRVKWGVEYRTKKDGSRIPWKDNKYRLIFSYAYMEIDKIAKVTSSFKTSKLEAGFLSSNEFENWTNSNWDNDTKQYCYVANVSSREEMIKGPDYHRYKMTDLKEDKEQGIKAMTKEERVTKFLMSAYRSGEIMNYGKVYISDIVAQLCELEGWKNPVIVATTATDYKDPCLDMGGVSALEYISTTLCENAVEAGGLGRAGFTCYFDKKGTFHFEPVNAFRDKNVKTLQFGYNVNNSSILSFTCRSKGKELMLEMETDLSGYNMLTGEDVSANVSRQDLMMSVTERKLYNKSSYAKDTNGDGRIDNNDDVTETVWFNLPLFNYYGYQQDVTNYESFTKDVASNNEISWGTNLVRRYYKSSLSSSTNAALTALNDLIQLKNSPLKAELSMIGDNEVTPGSYIYILNHARNGFHYTSGYYFIRQITDSVTTGNGFTQNLDLIRYSDTVYNMTNNIKPQMIANSAYETALEEAVDLLKTDKDKFQELYDNMYKE